MRLAIVVGSTYEKNGRLPRMASAQADCELVARRLAQSDAGFWVQRLPAQRDLPEVLEQFLVARGTRIEQLLVYYAGYALLSPQRGPGLLLDGPKMAGMSARVLRKIIERHAVASCVMIDATAVLDAGQHVASVVSGLGAGLTQGHASVSALVAARPMDGVESETGSPFTQLLLSGLDWLSSSRQGHQAIDPAALFNILRADVSTWSAAGRTSVAPGSFVILPPVDARTDGASRRAEAAAREATPKTALASEPKNLYLTFAEGTARLTVSLTPDTNRSARAMEQMLLGQPGDVSLRDRLIQLYTTSGESRRALEHCRFLARLAPARADTYRRARDLFERAGAPDGAWNAASVLACLGADDVDESGLHKRRPDGLLAVRSTILDDDWTHALLSSAGEDPVVDALLDALGPAAVRAGLGVARLKKGAIEPRPEWFHDIDKSTTTLAKTLAWTARVLGMAPPSLYVAPDLGVTLEAPPTEELVTVAGRAVGSGFSLSQLAFLCGRHVSAFRSVLRPLAFFSTPADLALLLEATAALVDSADAGALGSDAKRLYQTLRTEVRDLGPLKHAARAWIPDSFEPIAARALARAERVGVRAGLVACGDVCIAADLIDRFPTAGILSKEEQRSELFAFAISNAYGALREKLGLASAA
jgi:hypothetical protein